MTRFEDYIYTEREDWDQIFDDFAINQIGPTKIADLIGIAASSLQRLRDGVEPRHSVGVALLELHSRHCST